MSRESGNRRLFSSVGPFLTLGIQLALTVILLFFLGRWLDGKFGTAPWLMLGGIVIGITGGLIKFIRTSMEIGREEDARDKMTKPRQ
ncbi:MAG: AtpZ/AtpI family protein [Bacteroidota bacterium]